MADHGMAALWDQRYGEPGYSFGAEPNVFLKSQAALFKSGQRVLVPGDGEGRNGVWLAAQGLTVDSVDASARGVEKALGLAAERGVRINAVAADLTTWAWPVGVYDAVVSIYLHFKEDVRPLMHRRMFDSLKLGGMILIEAYAPRQLELHKTGTVGGPKEMSGIFTHERLRADFAGADIVSCEEAEVDLAEGSRHTGRSGVIRFIARKRS